MDLDEARRVISVYREANFKITTLWRDAGYMLENMARGDSVQFGLDGKFLQLTRPRNAIMLPSGLLMRYDELAGEQGERGVEYTYKVRRGRNRIYGGKVIENVCQASCALHNRGADAKNC